jgi:hypothetical protein
MEKLPVTLDELCRIVESRNPKEGALTHLGEAVHLADEMAAMGDRLIEHFVDSARDSGASWSEIGERLGVSKQAAQKRFVTKRTSGLFTRFSDEAQATVMDAMALAQKAGAHHIGTDHLVLAMIADDEQPMGRALASVGVPIEQIRSEVRSAVGISETPSQGQIPFAADSKKALELALREAIRAGDKRIRSRHILLGLLRDPKSHGASILGTHGVTHAAVEGWLGPDSGLE